MQGAIQNQGKGDGDYGHDESKELAQAQKDDRKNPLKTFKRRPRSNNKNDDMMEIDAKKRLFSSEEGCDSEVAKKIKSNDGSKLRGDEVFGDQKNEDNSNAISAAVANGSPRRAQ